MRIKLSFIIILSSFLFTSCDNDVNILSDSTPIPIVYGLVDLSDTATYIRVEKSFADPKTPPTDLAENPDQLYYDNIEVLLKDINKDTSRGYALKRVDGNKEGYERKEGPFAEAPNYLYKIENSELPFKNSSKARIIVKKSDSDSTLAMATTEVLDTFNIYLPNPDVTPALRITPSEVLRLRLAVGLNPDEVSYFLGSVDYVVKEFDNNTNKVINRYEKTIYVDQVKSQYDIELMGAQLYNSLDAILDSKAGVYRRVDSLYFHVMSFGIELKEYQDIQKLNSGITSSSYIPVYNNIQNGRGLFTSSSSDKTGPFTLSRLTYDSLNNYSATEDLNFKFN